MKLKGKENEAKWSWSEEETPNLKLEAPRTE